MNAKYQTPNTLSHTLRARFNTVKNLRPDVLSRALEAFEEGRLGGAARIFESILARDDVICGLNLKRKKSVARLESEVVLLEESPAAREHKMALEEFYATLETRSRVDGNECGGLRLLISQMMDSVAMRYAVHRMRFEIKSGSLRGAFEQYPLWLFENTTGVLRLLKSESQIGSGEKLNPGEWMVSRGDGLMFPSSIAHIFKELPLKDWLVYCERNGMPGIKAKTDAYPGSPQWEAACEAVAEFGAEFHAVLSEGTDIEAIDVSTSGQLPYPAIVERMDRMLCALWRGSDLSTMSGSDKVGASAQWYESTMIEEDDATNISDTLNRNVDSRVIKLIFGDVQPLAKFRLKLPDYEAHKCELEIMERLCALGLKPDAVELARRFAFPLAKEISDERCAPENGTSKGDISDSKKSGEQPEGDSPVQVQEGRGENEVR